MTIIGIAGGTGSGKTTVVKRISKALPPHCAAVIPLDSYYNDTSSLTPEERKAINFDHPDAFDWRLLTEHIRMLKEGKAVEQPTYSYIESNRQKETQADQAHKCMCRQANTAHIPWKSSLFPAAQPLPARLCLRNLQ